MTEDKVHELLHDVADGIEPGDRLASIRSATAARGGRTTWGWWAAGGAGLVAASVVTALVVGGGMNPQSSREGPATSPSTSVESDDGTLGAVYYVGDTPDGPRLYREFRRLPGSRLPGNAIYGPAVAAALGSDTEGAPLAPLDPDYRTPWPAETVASVWLLFTGDKAGGVDHIEINLEGVADLRERGSLSEAEASLAIEQLIRTVQGAVGEPVPVRFLIDTKKVDQVLGVPTGKPLVAGSSLATLAHVSLSDPAEGRIVDNDDPFLVKGVGNSFEGNIVTRIQQWEGSEVVAEEPATAGWMEDRLFPFTVTFDLSNVPPGDYVVISSTDDPSGRGREHTDTRRITIVD